MIFRRFVQRFRQQHWGAIVPALRKRIIDPDTRITKLTVSSQRLLDGLRNAEGNTP